jgi:hypothetical protein
MIEAEVEHRQKKATGAPAPAALTAAKRPSSKGSSDPSPM